MIKEVSEIDKFIKTKILGEAISLMKKKSLLRDDVESYKGWIRILPDSQYDEYDAFCKAKRIFNKLQGIKSSTISLNKFANLSKYEGMTNEKLMKANYEIIYKRITQQTDQAKMSLETFFSALELLSQTLYEEEG